MRTTLVHILLALLLLGNVGPDPKMPLPVSDQVPLFLKILAYEKDLGAASDDLVIGVFYQERYRQSVVAKNAVVEGCRARCRVGERRVLVKPIPLTDQTNLAAALARHEIDVVYVTPLRAYNVSRIATATQAEDVLTLTGVPSYLEVGLSVSLNLKGGKPVILINLPAAQEEGAKFHSQLLRLAQVIR